MTYIFQTMTVIARQFEIYKVIGEKVIEKFA